MARVFIGVDPHKLSATIEVVDDREKVLATGLFATDKAAYAAMRKHVPAIPSGPLVGYGARTAARSPPEEGWPLSMDHMTGAGLEADVTEIRAALARMPFPAEVDDVLARLVRQRAPSQLLWRVGGLPHTQPYPSLDDLCGDVARRSGAGAPPPPRG